MTMTDHTELDALIASLGIEYKAEFVPQRLSRNSGEERPSLNWRVTISKNGHALATDYTQGIGHLPKDTAPRARDNSPWTNTLRATRDRYSAEHGTYSNRWRDTRVPGPLLRDVLHSLILDSDVVNYDGFEDWAGTFGFDEDSRSAERTYNACREIASQLRAVIGRAAIGALREAYQDY